MWFFSYSHALGSGLDSEGKCTVLSYAELVQCVAVHNLQYSWESSLDTYPLAAQCVQPTPAKKESDKVMPYRNICVKVIQIPLITQHLRYLLYQMLSLCS